MTRKQLSTILLGLLIALPLIAGCESNPPSHAATAVAPGAASNVYAAKKSRTCETCTRANMGVTGFALPVHGVLIYQGSVKIFDLDNKVFSTIRTDPPLRRPAPARVVERKDEPLSDEDYAWVLGTANAAWNPTPSGMRYGCGGAGTWLPALVVLIDRDTFFAAAECSAADDTGELLGLRSIAERIAHEGIYAMPAGR